MDAPNVSICLMGALVVLAHFQPTAPRTFAALCFCAGTCGHAVIFWNLDGFSYYLTSAVFELGAIFAINCIYPPSRLGVWLQRICFAMILANAAGAFLWWAYYGPTLYNWTFVTLYMAALGALLRKRTQHNGGGGGFELARWRACFRFHHFASVDFMRRVRKELQE